MIWKWFVIHQFYPLKICKTKILRLKVGVFVVENLLHRANCTGMLKQHDGWSRLPNIIWDVFIWFGLNMNWMIYWSQWRGVCLPKSPMCSPIGKNYSELCIRCKLIECMCFYRKTEHFCWWPLLMYSFIAECGRLLRTLMTCATLFTHICGSLSSRRSSRTADWAVRWSVGAIEGSTEFCLRSCASRFSRQIVRHFVSSSTLDINSLKERHII